MKWCGLCVGGQTGRADSEGLDRCNVCLGDNRCVGCDDVVGSNKVADACGACLAPDDAAQDNCTRITSVFPTSLDRAVDKVVTVNVRGAGISPSSLPDVSCSLEPTTQQQGREALRVEKLSVEDGLIQLQMGLTDRLGLYTINCSSNSKGPVDTGNGVALLIVDSKQLCVTASKPTNVSVGDPFQVKGK
ncbi:hypothetical protein ANN_24215 [Periplaneta americana]|uniref:Uncharacterized protein n=1 Tax=Periplaneta americana TaxID=6978 RepID=A0ABQ8S2R6_PERAM|nr:hypothetical protein ANN_24215 [Periplaneta americana]